MLLEIGERNVKRRSKTIFYFYTTNNAYLTVLSRILSLFQEVFCSLIKRLDRSVIYWRLCWAPQPGVFRYVTKLISPLPLIFNKDGATKADKTL